MTIDIESVEFLNVPPNSVLIVKLPPHASAQDAQKIRAVMLERHLPNVADVLVVSIDCEFLVVAQNG